ADTEALADLGDAQALGEVGFGLAQLGDDFLGRVSLHGSSPGPAGPQRLSYHLDQFLGSRPPARPRFQDRRLGHAVERVIDLDRPKALAVIAEHLLVRQVLGIERALPLLVRIAAGADVEV